MKDHEIRAHVRWFSGTGNSLAVARSLSASLGASSCESLLSTKGGRADGDPGRYLFVFPLYYLGLPKAVDDAIRAFPFRDGDDICAVITRGVGNMGAALGALDRLLRERGSLLRYGAYVDMPQNDVTLFSVKSDESNRRKLERAPRRLERIVRDIEGWRARRDLEPSFFMGRARRRYYLSHILGSHERYYVGPECSGCGVCARLCPLGRIEMLGGKPSWKAGCQECEACINLCPAAAIQYRGGGTEAKRRYHHPGIGWEEIAAQRD